MAYKIVTPNEENLTQVLRNIELWFNNTHDFKVGFTEEIRKFFNAETKQIEERSINVIEVEEYGTSKQAKIKFIPLIDRKSVV